MSRLTIYPDSNPERITFDSEAGAEIAKALGAIGVRFERWETQAPLPEGADDEAVMEAYNADIERLKSENGYKSVDVIRLAPDNPRKEEFRLKFLSEHTHAEDEVRFFVEGAGVFYLREKDQVYMTLCTRGDLISVPAGVRHWFDMGPQPSLTCIRLFTTPEGWIADFTGDDIADKFPKFERRAA
ncbi:MAG: acireductone dioxygenase [Alphaproteobacteria bacterium]|nr:acireductone dioxygenase [Alphaproteobacteria bacterium]